MATKLTQCHACNKEIAEEAKVCVHCGAERQSKSALKLMTIFTGALANPGVGLLTSIIFMSGYKKEVPTMYFAPAVIMLFLFWLARTRLSYTEKTQGIKFKDSIWKITSFLIFLPSWIVFIGVIAIPIDIYEGITGVSYIPHLMWFTLLAYIPYLKIMKYI